MHSRKFIIAPTCGNFGYPLVNFGLNRPIMRPRAHPATRFEIPNKFGEKTMIIVPRINLQIAQRHLMMWLAGVLHSVFVRKYLLPVSLYGIPPRHYSNQRHARNYWTRQVKPVLLLLTQGSKFGHARTDRPGTITALLCYPHRPARRRSTSFLYSLYRFQVRNFTVRRVKRLSQFLQIPLYRRRQPNSTVPFFKVRFNLA